MQQKHIHDRGPAISGVFVILFVALLAGLSGWYLAANLPCADSAQQPCKESK